MNDLIIFYTRDELLRMEVEKIVYFEAVGNYTRIVSKNDFKVLIPGSLNKTTEELTKQMGERARMFLRVGKCHIVNTAHIRSINMASQQLILTDLESFIFKLQISKEALKQVKELIINGII